MRKELDKLLRAIEMSGNECLPVYEHDIMNLPANPQFPQFDVLSVPARVLKQSRADISLLLFFASLLMKKDPTEITPIDLYSYLYKELINIKEDR